MLGQWCTILAPHMCDNNANSAIRVLVYCWPSCGLLVAVTESEDNSSLPISTGDGHFAMVGRNINYTWYWSK